MAKQVDYQLSINLAGVASSSQAFKRIKEAVEDAASSLAETAEQHSISESAVSISITTPVYIV